MLIQKSSPLKALHDKFESDAPITVFNKIGIERVDSTFGSVIPEKKKRVNVKVDVKPWTEPFIKTDEDFMRVPVVKPIELNPNPTEFKPTTEIGFLKMPSLNRR